MTIHSKAKLTLVESCHRFYIEIDNKKFQTNNLDDAIKTIRPTFNIEKEEFTDSINNTGIIHLHNNGSTGLVIDHQFDSKDRITSFPTFASTSNEELDILSFKNTFNVIHQHIKHVQFLDEFDFINNEDQIVVYKKIIDDIQLAIDSTSHSAKPQSKGLNNDK